MRHSTNTVQASFVNGIAQPAKESEQRCCFLSGYQVTQLPCARSCERGAKLLVVKRDVLLLIACSQHTSGNARQAIEGALQEERQVVKVVHGFAQDAGGRLRLRDRCPARR